jgi:hypothetical protein
MPARFEMANPFSSIICTTSFLMLTAFAAATHCSLMPRKEVIASTLPKLSS